MNLRPIVTIIAAIAHNGVIGQANRLPWHLPADLKHFKRLTMGHAIVMGRKTWESLPGLLPHRSHVVITRDTDYKAQGAMVAHSLDQALEIAGGEEVFVIGGAQLYAGALPVADRMLLTEVDFEAEGDTFFPDYDALLWDEVGRESHLADERNPHAYAFVELVRRDYRNLGVVSDAPPDVSGIA